MAKFPVEDYAYGFTWGPADVIRIASDDKWGVMLEVRTPRQRLEIRVTPSGIVRVGKPERRAGVSPLEHP